MAQLLAKRGLRSGDRLCVYLANCVEMIDLFLACVKQGVIFVPINILYKEREIVHILTDAEPRAVVTATIPFPAGVPIWNPSSWSQKPHISAPSGRPLRSTGTPRRRSSTPRAPRARPKARS